MQAWRLSLGTVLLGCGTITTLPAMMHGRHPINKSTDVGLTWKAATPMTSAYGHFIRDTVTVSGT